MLQKRVPVWTIAVVAGALLLLFSIGVAIHSAGWSDGFALGIMAGGNGETAALAPLMAARGGWGWHGGGFGFIGGFFRLIFFFLGIALLFKFLGFWRWRMHHRHSWDEGYPGPDWGQRPPREPAPAKSDDSVHL